MTAAVGTSPRDRGDFPTPAPIARILAQLVVTPHAHRILDPSCGSGNLLLAAADRLTSLHPHLPRPALAARLVGIEIHPPAAEDCARRLNQWAGLTPSGASIAVADTLGLAPAPPSPAIPAGPFDAILANPPFIDSESMARAHTPGDPDPRDLARARFATARGNWDLSLLFLEWSLQHLAPGGRLGIILPATFLAARYADFARTHAAKHRIRGIISLDGAPPFVGTNVRTIILVIERRAAAHTHRVRLVTPVGRTSIPQRDLVTLPGGSWHAALDHAPDGERAALLRAFRVTGRTLADVADIRDGATTAQAYALRPLVREGPEGLSLEALPPGSLALINSGTIDPFRLLWGGRVTRYLGVRARRPILDRDAVARVAPARAAACDRPRVAVAGLSARIEAAVAPPGVLPGKSTVVLTPREGIDAHALAAWLNDPLLTDLYRLAFGTRGFGPRSLAIGPRELASLPAPASDAPLAPGSPLARVRSDEDAAAFHGVVRELLGCAPRPGLVPLAGNAPESADDDPAITQ